MFYNISLAVGILLLAISILVFKKSLAFIKNSQRATGTVIELERIQDSDGSTYKPIFRFRTLTNEEVIHKHGVSSSPPSWKVGETTTIAYDPDNPTKARLLTYFGAFGWSIVLLAIAMPFLVIGGGYYLVQPLLR